MSYEIIYDKQFIDLQDGRFVPMLLAGSNNCYDMWNKRARSWSNMSYILKGKLAGSLTEMEQNAYSELERMKETYPDEASNAEDRFGSQASLQIGTARGKSTFGMYLGIFRTGCKKALTVEQLKDERISVRIFHPYYVNKEEFTEKYGFEPWSDIPETTEDLITLIAKYAACNASSSITLEYPDEKQITRIRKKYFPKAVKPQSREKVDHFYYVYAIGRGAVRKTSSKHIWFSYSPDGGRKFKTEKQANKYLEKLARRSFPVSLEVRKENSETFI